MKVLISGSRTITNKNIVYTAIEKSPFNPDTIIHGGAKGVDSIAKSWAIDNNIEIDSYSIDDEDNRYSYDKHKKRAPLIRNKIMVNKADALIAIWDRKSTGTMHTLDIAKDEGMKLIRKLIIKNITIFCLTHKHNQKKLSNYDN